ncbi:elongation factor G [Limibacter armeniacum]|uniref:elongation factor G n=1 Tax=Limibacter armeniacum TaxID=466084 RepID=UPI002FE57BE2
MKVYDQKHIKNIVLLGSSKSGKTTLAETMLYEAGVIHRHGYVEEHNTVSDYHDIEHEREYSIYATSMHTEWRNYKINIIDAPGISDFIGEVVSSVKAADTCLMLINASTGVESGDETVWEYIEQFSKPSIFVINQIDHPKADFQYSFGDIQEKFGNNAVLMQYPLNSGEAFDSIIDLLKMKMYKFPPEGGKPEKLPIPDNEIERANQLHNELVEKAAENDEGLMEKYFDKGNLSEDELREGLKIGMVNHDVFPVFCLSAKKNMGSGRLMGFIDNVAPSASDLKPEPLTNDKSLPYDTSGTPAVFIFKTINEPFLGRISYFKVISGEITPDTDLYNKQTNTPERLHQLYIIDGKERNSIQKLVAGDIGATVKLKNTHTNQTLTLKDEDIIIKPMSFPSPQYICHVHAASKDQNEKLGEALREIAEEDPTVKASYSKELKQLILYCQGEFHRDIIQWKLEKIYQLNVTFEPAKIPYRETITKQAEATYRHKKQSGGAGQFGEVTMKIEPYYDGMPEPSKEMHVRGKEEVDLKWGGKLLFYNCIVGGAIDTRFLSAIKKGVLEIMEEGPVTKSHVRDVCVMVFDGKMHSVDSNDISFQLAGKHAFKEAFLKANPQILEPLYEMEIKVPEDQLGDVMTDLQSRRATITGIDANGNRQIISAKTPLKELHDYSTRLKSLTQGLGTFKWKFSEYAPVPYNMQEDMLKEAAAE